MADKYDTVIDRKPRQETQIQKPEEHMVVIFNDDDTPFELVVKILTKVFNISSALARAHTKDIDELGKTEFKNGYTAEVAETKAWEISDRAKAEQYALRAEAIKVS